MNHPSLMTVQAVSTLIEQGRTLALAGEAGSLRKLPRGRWIGGTIPYFMSSAGGVCDREQLFVHDLSDWGSSAEVHSYDVEHLHQVLSDAPEHGVSLIIIPAESAVHYAYARNAPNYEDMYIKPIVGWIAGVHLTELGTTVPMVFNGQTGIADDNSAAVIHIRLPDYREAVVDIVNLFQPGDGPSFIFPDTGFSATECLIDGKLGNLADYMTQHQCDTRWPLVADYCGASINVSFKALDADAHRVDLYAPVFPGVEYRLAHPVGDYVSAFQQATPKEAVSAVFSCNCILNYLYGDLEGHRTPSVGPITFGEVAYQLLNQTLVYVHLHDA